MNETLEQFLGSSIHNYHGEKPRYIEQCQALLDYRDHLVNEGDFEQEDADNAIIGGIVNDYITVYNYKKMCKYKLFELPSGIVWRGEYCNAMWYVYDSRN